jgi:glutamyl-Q tRNA(Asp) synthetase
LRAIREAVEKLAAMGLIYPAFESRTEIARLVALRESEAPWPRDPDGRRSIRERKSLAPDERDRLTRRARLTRCGSTWRPPAAARKI